MKYLFTSWREVFSRIKKSPKVFIFFDYDGTLTPIVSTPEEALFPKKTKKLVNKLKNHSKFLIAIVSGRSLKSVKSMVNLKGLIYAGNHGLEIEGRGIKFSKPLTVNSFKPLMKKISKFLHKTLKDIKGSRVEDKGATLSVHYRLVKSKDVNLLKSRFNKIVAPYIDSKKIRLSAGKKVLEVRPNLDWHKGKAVLTLLKGVKNTLPIYLGDDVTDMDAFRAIKGKGISIFVGGKKKGINADYFLKDTREVVSFIEKLLKGDL